MAPLSVHRPGLGIRRVMPWVAQRSKATWRKRELAATPPAITSELMPVFLAAAIALSNKTSTMASWKEAATSFFAYVGVASKYLATAVFKPENENSNGLVSQSLVVVNPRGKSIAVALPVFAIRSIAGPPGKPRSMMRAILSKASPAASSMVSPSLIISPVMSLTCSRDEWPPLTSNAIVGSAGRS